MCLLSHVLNENKNKVGRAGRMMPTNHPSNEPGAKQRKIRLSVRDDIRFPGVGLHLPIFGEARGRCEWCQTTTPKKLESRPFSKYKQCNVFFCLGKKRNCFVEYYDENYLFEEAPLAEVETVYSASEESDGQASDLEPTNKECSSSSADSASKFVLFTTQLHCRHQRHYKFQQILKWKTLRYKEEFSELILL
jgi:hypothetical protein